MRPSRFQFLAAAMLVAMPAALVLPTKARGQDGYEFIPGTLYLNCGPMTPTLEFTHEDFQKGFARTYQFPGTKYCELGQLGNRGGTIALKYVPGPGAPLHAELNFWEVFDCSSYEDESRTGRFTYTWSGKLMPTDDDPDGVFPAASFEELFAEVKTSVSGDCDADERRAMDYMHIQVGLVGRDPQAGDVGRTAYVRLKGDVTAEIAFAGAGKFGVGSIGKGVTGARIPALSCAVVAPQFAK